MVSCLEEKEWRIRGEKHHMAWSLVSCDKLDVALKQDAMGWGGALCNVMQCDAIRCDALVTVYDRRFRA